MFGRQHPCISYMHAITRNVPTPPRTRVQTSASRICKQEALAANREENEAAKERALAMCSDEHEKLIKCFKGGSWFTLCSTETEEFWKCYRRERVRVRAFVLLSLRRDREGRLRLSPACPPTYVRTRGEMCMRGERPPDLVSCEQCRVLVGVVGGGGGGG